MPSKIDISNEYVARFSTTPALVEEGSGDRVSALLMSLHADPHHTELRGSCDAVSGAPLAGRLPAETTERMSDDFWFAADDWRSNYRPYRVMNGILQIPIKGVLLHDFPWSFGAYATGYVYIWKAFERGMRDPEVKGIALVTDSPGGEVAGCFDLVDKLVAGVPGVERKPVLGISAENAYSAAYAVISISDRIVVSRTGGVGSIGVVTAHVDASQAVKDMGYKITFIFAGKHKVDGNPYEALSASVKARIQKRIDKLYTIFVETVASNRALSVQAVRNTEALTYNAEDAIAEGLADDVGNLEDSLTSFSNELLGHAQNGDTDMSTAPLKTEASAAAILTHSQAQVDAAVATASTTARAEGVTAERTRITAALALPEAAKRPASAQKLALTTDMTVEQIKGVLAVLPEDAPATATAPAAPAAPDALASAMERTGGGAKVDGGDAPQLSTVDRILLAQNPDYVPKAQRK